MLLYRPNQRRSCCPHYTIRLDSHQYKPRADQRQAVNRFNRFVLGEEYIKEAAKRYPRSREESRRRDTEFDVVERIHEAERINVKTPPEPAVAFSVTLEPDTFTEEKFAVFKNYQNVVHGEALSDISVGGFTRFLCSSPIRRRTEITKDGVERKLGSYHQCYRLDGKLVAVGVLDLLPHSVSGVYFFYHESIHRFSPGKFSAMREIALAKEKGYRWWYPGFYIHSCLKMRYKIDYSPQFVLDPETYRWDPIDETVLANFNMKPYFSMARLRRNAARQKRLAAAGASSTEGESTSETTNNAMQTDDDAARAAEKGDDGALYYDDDAAAANPDAEDDDDSLSERSLFRARMPGIPSIDEVRTWPLGELEWFLESPRDVFLMSDLSVWPTQRVDDEGTVKHRVAELAAAVGLDLAKDEILIDFSSVGS